MTNKSAVCQKRGKPEDSLSFHRAGFATIVFLRGRNLCHKIYTTTDAVIIVSEALEEANKAFQKNQFSDATIFFIALVKISIDSTIQHSRNSEFYFEEFTDVPATFGPDLSEGSVRGMLINATPPSACDEKLKPAPPYDDNILEKWILIVPRYTPEINCTFEQKVRMAQLRGYNAVIVYNVGSNDLVPMSAKNGSGFTIPSVFVSQSSGLMLKNVYTDPNYFIVITAETPFNIQTHLLIPFAIVVGICFLVMIIFMVVKYVKDRRRQRRYRLPKSQLNKIPTCKFQKGDRYETCAICLEDYIEGEKLRVLPCNHMYHMKCIDPWLTKNKRVCPICKRKVFAHDEPHPDSDSDSDTDDTTPLIRSGVRGTQGGTFEVQNESRSRMFRAARSISQLFDGRSHFLAASDHHSINTERQERQSLEQSESSDTSSSDSDQNAPVHVVDEVSFILHNSDQHDSRSDSQSLHHDSINNEETSNDHHTPNNCDHSSHDDVIV